MKPRLHATQKTRTRVRKDVLRPALSSLKVWFERSGLPLSEKQYKQLWLYHTLLRQKNAQYDLTRIYQFDNMVQKHYIDCILVAKLLRWKLPSPILDIGTGAGFPGIPLKIVCPQTAFILAEGRHRRIRFLTEAVEALGLKGMEIYEGKIYASFDRSVNGVITRALEVIPKTLARIRNCLAPGGEAIFMKGPHCDEEIEQVSNRFGEEYTLLHDLRYAIPNTTHHRRLIVFRRNVHKYIGSQIVARST
jgi:16S rRNA (guanine(527)-N(7))-methyltransferase RsmG